MAYIYKDQPGRRAGTQYKIANLDGVQDYLDEFIFNAEVRAEEALQDIRGSADYTGDGDVTIEVEEGDIDRYLILNDERGQQAAMSIEYGHGEYTVEEEMPDGTTWERTVPASEGTFILHKAVRVPPGKLKGTGGGSF